jgi:hypothetical protein
MERAKRARQAWRLMAAVSGPEFARRDAIMSRALLKRHTPQMNWPSGRDMSRIVRRAIASEAAWLAIYLVIVMCATTICIDRHCNNFLIFRAAFGHLIAARDLYAAYPGEHADLFKYSPTFALLFAPFARLPFGAALLLWNLINVLSIFVALRAALPARYRLTAIQLTGIGLVTTVDGSQSNGLVAALLLLAFASLERGRLGVAAASIAAGALIKLFPLAAAVLALPRRDRWRFAALGVAIGIAAILLPLWVVDAHVLIAEYRSWYHLGAVDALDRGASAMRLLHLVSGYDGPNWPVQLAGTVMLVMPLLVRPSRWMESDFRLAFLASVLVYAVIFNHKAEQPSFIIAIVGVAIWHACSPQSPVRTVLTACTFISTVPVLVTVAASSSGHLTAKAVDIAVLTTAVFCLVAWLTMQGELLDLFPERTETSDSDFAAVSDEPAM